MRSLWILGALVMFGGCATTSGAGGTFDSRLPNLAAVVRAAKTEAWGADLKQIPATVVEVGELASVPYVSFAGKDVEVNVYGDPDHPAGLEVGTKSDSPELRAQLRTFIGNLLTENDRKPLAGLPEGKEATTDGLAVEITLPTAADGFGAWWVTAMHPVGLEKSRATVGEIGEIARAPADELNEPLAFADVGSHPAFAKYTRYRPASTKVYATSYYKKDGVYRRRK